MNPESRADDVTLAEVGFLIVVAREEGIAD